MRLLVLGGTVFLGRHVVQQALERGWHVTTFNRGQTNPDLFPNIDRRLGNRLDSDLASLREGEWDACIDTSGYVPRVVREAASTLSDRVAHYQFVSSISVYQDSDAPTLDEHSPVIELADPESETIDAQTYGGLKVLCEREACHFGTEYVIVRPGLIVGPDDKSDRFTYWPVRMQRGGQIVVPDADDQPVQLIDVRDLAHFMLDLAASRTQGIFNATGPWPPYSLDEVLDACRREASNDAQPIGVPSEVLATHGVEPWTGLPLWLGDSGWNMSRVDVTKALSAGMSIRPLSETIRDTLRWWNALDPARELRAGISSEKEREILAAIQPNQS